MLWNLSQVFRLSTARFLGSALKGRVWARSLSQNSDFAAVKQLLLKTYNDLNKAVVSQDPKDLSSDVISKLSRLKPIGDHLLTLEALQTSQDATESLIKGSNFLLSPLFYSFMFPSFSFSPQNLLTPEKTI